MRKKNLTHSFMRILVRTLKGRVTKHLNNFLVISMMHRNWPIVHLRPYPYMYSTNIRDTYNAQNYQKSRFPKHTHIEKWEKCIFSIQVKLPSPIWREKSSSLSISSDHVPFRCYSYILGWKSHRKMQYVFMCTTIKGVVLSRFCSVFILLSMYFSSFVCSSISFLPLCVQLFFRLHVYGHSSIRFVMCEWVNPSIYLNLHMNILFSMAFLFILDLFFPLHFIFVHSFTYFPAFLWTFYSLWYLVSEQYYLLWSLVKHRMSYEK